MRTAAMTGNWRQHYREAEKAFRANRLENASRLIRRYELTHHRIGEELATRVATALLKRAAKSANRKDLNRAWLELHEARLMHPDEGQFLRQRTLLVEQTLATTRQHLTRGNVGSALDCLSLFERFRVRDHRSDVLVNTIQNLHQADEFAREGRFGEAVRAIEVTLRVMPEMAVLQTKLDRYKAARKELREATDRLRKSVNRSRWTDVLAQTDRLLQLAPKYQIAIDAQHLANESLTDARLSASQEMKPDSSRPGTPRYTDPTQMDRAKRTLSITSKSDYENGLVEAFSSKEACTPAARHNTSAIDSTQMDSSQNQPSPADSTRPFVIWIDGVGGYLVCPGEHIMVGQAVPDSGVEIPIQADLSRRHMRISRSTDQYLLEPYGLTRVNGSPVKERVALNDGFEIELGLGVCMRFRQPHALSGSARLDFVSRHRTHPWTDGIILLSDSLVLGPNRQNHIVCPQWKDELVVFRRHEEWFCRGPERMQVDGIPVESQATITTRSRIEGEDFALSFESPSENERG